MALEDDTKNTTSEPDDRRQILRDRALHRRFGWGVKAARRAGRPPLRQRYQGRECAPARGRAPKPGQRQRAGQADTPAGRAYRRCGWSVARLRRRRLHRGRQCLRYRQPDWRRRRQWLRRRQRRLGRGEQNVGRGDGLDQRRRSAPSADGVRGQPAAIRPPPSPGAGGVAQGARSRSTICWASPRVRRSTPGTSVSAAPAAPAGSGIAGAPGGKAKAKTKVTARSSATPPMTAPRPPAAGGSSATGGFRLRQPAATPRR